MTPDEVAEHFPDRRRAGDGWEARCLVHEDHSPSVSINAGRDGGTVVYCHAGCPTPEVIGAVGLTMRDLAPDDDHRSTNGSRTVTARYRYTDADGVLLFEVLRYLPKGFAQVPANGRRGPGSMNGTPLVLYRLPSVVAAVAAGTTVLLVEGEKDADRAIAEGYVATTAPMGAGKWHKVADHARHVLTGADVVIVADRDTAGYEHARKVAASLNGVAKSVLVVEPLEGKDLCDHIAAGHTVEDLVEVGVEAPPPVDEPDDTIEPPRLVFQHLPDPLVITPLQWHARGLWCHGTYGELAGPEKSLKSYLSTAMGVGLAAGVTVLGRWPVDTAQRVLMLIGEGGMDGFHRRLQRIVGAYGVTLGDVRPNLRYTAQTAPVSSLRFIESVVAELDAFDPHLVMLDPWYAYAPADVDARNLYEQGAALDRLGSMVTRGGASLLLANHYNQTGNGAGLQRISMAGHAEWCDSWLLVNHRTAPDVDAGRFRLKLNVGSRQWGGAEHHVDFDIGRWDDDLNDHVGALRWTVGPATDADDRDPLEVKVADYEARLIATWRRRRGTKTPWTQSEWFDRTTGANTDKRVAWLRLVDLGRIVELPIGVVDSAGRTQPSGRFALVESPLEMGET